MIVQLDCMMTILQMLIAKVYFYFIFDKKINIFQNAYQVVQRVQLAINAHNVKVHKGNRLQELIIYANVHLDILMILQILMSVRVNFYNLLISLT